MKKLLSAPLSSRKIIEYLLLFLLLASVLSAAAYGGYWYGRRTTQPATSQSSSPKQSPQSRFPEKPSPQPVDETVGWKTFELPSKTGESCEFKYPKEWTYIEANGPSGEYSASFGLKSDLDSGLAHFFVERRSNFWTSVDDWFNKVVLYGDSKREYLTPPVSLTVGGVVAEQLDYIGRWGKTTFFLKGNYAFSTGVGSGNKERALSEDQIKTYETILSTFRFLDQEAVDETAGWKSYIVESGETSFKTARIYYPSSWELTAGVYGLELKKGDYAIRLGRADGGGNVCLYPGDKSEASLARVYGEYKEFYKEDGSVWRRAKLLSDGLERFRYQVCEKWPGYSDFSSITRISLFFDLDGPREDKQILDEFDQILEKIEILP